MLDMRLRNVERKQKSERPSVKNMTEDKNRPEQATGHLNISELSEDEIDQNLMGTFPASDPPSWTLGVARDKRPVSESQPNKAAVL